MRPVGPNKGVYGISVAAELVGMGPQRLRWYESHGLLEPDRTSGGTRRYSAADLDRLHRIDALLEAGLNLAGIAMVLDLQDANHRLHQQLGRRPDRRHPEDQQEGNQQQDDQHQDRQRRRQQQ